MHAQRNSLPLLPPQNRRITCIYCVCDFRLSPFYCRPQQPRKKEKKEYIALFVFSLSINPSTGRRKSNPSLPASFTIRATIANWGGYMLAFNGFQSILKAVFMYFLPHTTAAMLNSVHSMPMISSTIWCVLEVTRNVLSTGASHLRPTSLLIGKRIIYRFNLRAFSPRCFGGIHNRQYTWRFIVFEPGSVRIVVSSYCFDALLLNTVFPWLTITDCLALRRLARTVVAWNSCHSTEKTKRKAWQELWLRIFEVKYRWIMTDARDTRN